MEPPMSHDELTQCVISSQQSKINELEAKIQFLSEIIGVSFYNAEQKRREKMTINDIMKEAYKNYDWSKL